MSQGNKLFLHLSGQLYTVLGIDPFKSQERDQHQFSLNNINAYSKSGLSKVAGCRQKPLPTWLVPAGYSAWHFFTDGVL